MKTPRLTLSVPSLALVIAIALVYCRVQGHEFTSFDDDVYVTKNPYVKLGLESESLKWAFTTDHGSNWHPLTWISLVIDAQLFGVNAPGFLAINVLLHAFSTVLLFLLLNRVTRQLWTSALVAALFGLHPLHVESVAWVAERKDVLSGLFMMMTLTAYASYARTRVQSKETVGWYVIALLCFACGLMSKAMLVTLPVLMLLLDYWPLRRCAVQRDKWQVSRGSAEAGQNTSRKRPKNSKTSSTSLQHSSNPVSILLLEKLPFFALALVSMIVTFIVQSRGGAVGSVEEYSIGWRFGNALVSYVSYLMKTIWPSGLAFFYPVVEWPAWRVLVSGVFLLAVSAVVFWYARRRPYLVVGWLWYLVSLLPVIGLVHIGEHRMADRYTYIPLIGIFICIAYGVADIVPKLREQLRRKSPLIQLPVVCALVLILAVISWKQVGYWRNDTTLCERALEVTENNFKAHTNLGMVMQREKEFEKAIFHFSRAVEIKPNHERHYNLGNAYRRNGELDKALACYQTALEFLPGYEKAHNNSGSIYFKRKELHKAATHFAAAVESRPDVAEYHNNLGAVYEMQNDFAKAVERYNKAITLAPDYDTARKNLLRAEQKLAQ